MFSMVCSIITLLAAIALDPHYVDTQLSICRSAIRRVRQKFMQDLGRLQREAELSSDEQHHLAQSLQSRIDSAIAEVDTLAESKVQELTSL